MKTRRTTRCLAAAAALLLGFGTPALGPRPVAALVAEDCGAGPATGEPTVAVSDNEVQVDGDGASYSAPGGATPTRDAEVGTDGSAGVSLSGTVAGLDVDAGTGPDGPCQEVAVTPSVPRDDSGCGKPVGGPVTPRTKNPSQVEFPWNDDHQELDVTFTSARSCATLAGTLYGPLDLDARGALPAVLVIPPSGGIATRENVAYIARHLAGHGYVALTVDPQGVGESDVLATPPCGTEPGYSHPSPCEGVPFQRMDNWMEAGRTGLDYLLGPANPWAAHVDHGRIGATGHSLGARTASYLQDPHYDRGDGTPVRIHAVVGLDNLSSNYYGDASAASGGDVNTNDVITGQPAGGDEPIVVSVPGLGLSSDRAFAGDPDEKKFAARYHRAAGQPSGMLVFRGAAHDEFSQSGTSDPVFLERLAHYSLAWFDLWLDGDGHATAADRLLDRTVVGGDVTDVLSVNKRSGWYVPGILDGCEDWQTGCEVDGSTPVVPESPVAILLPLVALVLAFAILRRRTAR